MAKKKKKPAPDGTDPAVAAQILRIQQAQGLAVPGADTARLTNLASQSFQTLFGGSAGSASGRVDPGGTASPALLALLASQGGGQNIDPQTGLPVATVQGGGQGVPQSQQFQGASAFPNAPGVPGQQADASLRAAIQSAQLGMLSEETPFGSVGFQQTGVVGGVPQFTRQSQFAPQIQELFEGLLGLGQQQLGSLGGAFAPLDPGAFGGERAAIEEAAFNRALGLINPQFERDIGLFDVTAAERGLPIGSEARGRLLEPILEQRRVSLESLAQGAVQQGSAEQQRLFQQQAAAQQFPLQQFGGLLNLVGALGTPPQGQGVQFQGVAPPNLLGFQQFEQQLAEQQKGRKADTRAQTFSDIGNIAGLLLNQSGGGDGLLGNLLTGAGNLVGDIFGSGFGDIFGGTFGGFGNQGINPFPGGGSGFDSFGNGGSFGLSSGSGFGGGGFPVTFGGGFSF